MARIRTIKPEFWENEEMGKMPHGCRLLFIGMWNFADDQGVIKDNATLLKSKIFPYDENLRVSEVKKWIESLQNAQMLVPIIHNGESYLIICTFAKHQLIDKRYQKFCIPNDIVIKRLAEHAHTTTGSHSEHTVNTSQEVEVEVEMDMEKEELGGGGGNTGGGAALPDPLGDPLVDELGTSGIPTDPEPASPPPGSGAPPPHIPPTKKTMTDRIDAVVKYFNDTCTQLPKVSQLTESRKKSIKARLDEPNGSKDLRTAINKTAASDFLNGKSNRGWKANFDWIIAPKNYVKILEGVYDNSNGTATNHHNAAHTIAHRATSRREIEGDKRASRRELEGLAAAILSGTPGTKS